MCTPETTLRGSHPSLSGVRPSFDMRRTALTRAAAQGDRYMFKLTQVRVVTTSYDRFFHDLGSPGTTFFAQVAPQY